MDFYMQLHVKRPKVGSMYLLCCAMLALVTIALVWDFRRIHRDEQAIRAHIEASAERITQMADHVLRRP
jgi:hypothetical protein